MPVPVNDDYTPYEVVDVDDFGDGRHLGRLPLEVGAEGFRYGKQIWFLIPFSAFGGGIGGTGTGFKTFYAEWTIQIRESEAVGARVLFEQSVSLPIQGTVQLISGNVGFAFWAPIDQFTQIETTIVDGQDLPLGPFPGSTDPSDPQTHHQGWPYVDSNIITPFSENTFQLDYALADTSIFTVQGILVRLTYYSAPYKLTVQPGYIFDAVRDVVGLGFLDKEATYLVSFKEAAGFGYWLDTNSAAHFAIPNAGIGSGLLIQSRTARRGNGPKMEPTSQSAFLNGLAQPHLTKTSDAFLWLLASDQARIGRLYRSGDDGLTWEIVAVKKDGITTDVIMFGSDYNLLDMKPSPHGGNYMLAAKDGVLYFQQFPRPFEQNRTIGPARSGHTYKIGAQLGRTADGTIRIESQDHTFVSSDEFESKPLELEG